MNKNESFGQIKTSLLTVEDLIKKDEHGDRAGDNLDLISKILARGDQQELACLLQFYEDFEIKISREEIELFSYFQKLRKEVHKNCCVRKEERLNKNLQKTEDEVMLGVYIEEIESHVLESVLKLNKKGYITRGSGFSEFNSQKIYFKNEYFKNFPPPPELINWLKKKGVGIKIEAAAISLKLNKKMTLDNIAEVWQEVEVYLPDLKTK